MTTPSADVLSGYTLTLNEAAVLIDVSTKTIQRAVKAGRLSCIRVPARRGHELRFRPDEVRGLVPAPTPTAPVDAPVPVPAAEVEERKSIRKPEKQAPRAETSGKRGQQDQLIGLIAALSARVEGIDDRLIMLAEEEHAIVQVLAALPQQLAEGMERSARAAADAAAARERAAWLEGHLAETTRELATLRAQLLAPPEAPPPAEAEAPVEEPVPSAQEMPEVITKPWWRRLLGRS